MKFQWLTAGLITHSVLEFAVKRARYSAASLVRVLFKLLSGAVSTGSSDRARPLRLKPVQTRSGCDESPLICGTETSG
ncbi:hypothetical protein AOLI_G00181490 [Acnodon oligacanthus]